MTPSGETQPGRRDWYWRAHAAQRYMTIGHGTAGTRDGMVEQIAALLKHSKHIGAGPGGAGMELVIQPPERPQ